MIANICARPMVSASIDRIVPSPRSARAHLSTAHSKTPMMISATAISRGSRNVDSACFSSSSPAIAPGIVARIEIPDAPLLLRLRAALRDDLGGRAQQSDPLGTKVPQHGHQRSEMERDVEPEAGIGPVEEPRHERQMRRAADGQELGQPLHDAEDESVEDGHGADGRGSEEERRSRVDGSDSVYS